MTSSRLPRSRRFRSGSAQTNPQNFQVFLEIRLGAPPAGLKTGVGLVDLSRKVLVSHHPLFGYGRGDVIYPGAGDDKHGKGQQQAGQSKFVLVIHTSPLVSNDRVVPPPVDEEGDRASEKGDQYDVEQFRSIHGYSLSPSLAKNLVRFPSELSTQLWGVENPVGWAVHLLRVERPGCGNSRRYGARQKQSDPAVMPSHSVLPAHS